jgi:hypothetical protein
MLLQDGKLVFGEWLPDLPYYENPGLVEAKNCIPVDKHYKDFLPLTTEGDALPTSPPMGAFAAIDSNGDPEIYAGSDTDLYQRVSTAWTARSAATYGTATYWSFTQFDDEVIGTNAVDAIQSRTVGSASNFATLGSSGTPPLAQVVGVINRFVVAGNLNSTAGGASAVQWPAFDNPHDWPTPGGASANAVQAGRQLLNSAYGKVTAIANGEFWGLVFQQRAVTRFTYEGGDTVFQVQAFERNRGCWAPQSMIQIGALCYFLAADGFYMTDGQTVTPIGNAKVDKWFYGEFDQSYRNNLTVAADHISKCIFWSYSSPSASNGIPDRVIVYNYAENRWSWAEDAVYLLFQSFTTGYTLDQLDSLYSSIDSMPTSLDSALWTGGIPTVMGIGTDFKLGNYGGSALIARFETGEVDINPFGYALIRGVRPLVTGDPTNVTVALSARTSQDNSARSFGAATQRTTRTGVCDFRIEGRYLSARAELTGGFDRAIGLGVDAEATSLV